ncbi:lysylphosphatidylglycerol synthase transmembrane domain-containing protein [Haloplasma contractile]|uniref:Lysyltransferase n=1 Tax=Haloplasma contractile SSD-17B TaxID=1033810 RepID=U2E7D8_9MOLU|nr:lysylphosphatidylglycerol synthase transmembrane domain-containing protein [Haloplasma contractile]ERJ11118.1 hypothetical protein HLPCO_002857 [Haloplasma contractile SSD-17B]
MKGLIHKYRKNIIIIFAIALMIYFYFGSKQDLNLIMEHFKKIKLMYMILAFAIFNIYIFLEGLVLYLFSKFKILGIKFKDSYRLNLATQFFNSITPFATGGQPFQVYYLGTRGAKVSDATCVAIMNFITYSISIVLFGIFAIFTRYDYFNQQTDYGYLLLIGFGMNIFITLSTFVLAESKFIYNIIVNKIMLGLAKLNWLKRFKLEDKANKFSNFIEEFHKELIILKKNKGLLFKTISLHMIRNLIFYFIPILIFIGLGLEVKGHVFNLLVTMMFIQMIMSYTPTPGATGGAEFAFVSLFAIFFKEDVLFVAMLLWRLITYYLFILMGFLATISLNYKKSLESRSVAKRRSRRRIKKESKTTI